MLVAKVKSARMVSPKRKHVDMPIEGGFVGMVDREEFDEWLRDRAAAAGAARCTGTFETLRARRRGHGRRSATDPRATSAARPRIAVNASAVIGADGARSQVGRQTIDGAERNTLRLRLSRDHRIPQGRRRRRLRRAPAATSSTTARYSPDFYSWVFPHGETTSVGIGSANKGFSLHGSVGALREANGMTNCETIRKEGAPIPLKPLPRWDNGRDVLLAGDAAGVVAPASGEGIYYAMLGGQPGRRCRRRVLRNRRRPRAQAARANAS